LLMGRRWPLAASMPEAKVICTNRKTSSWEAWRGGGIYHEWIHKNRRHAANWFDLKLIFLHLRAETY
jgi:hypothetical protein